MPTTYNQAWDIAIEYRKKYLELSAKWRTIPEGEEARKTLGRAQAAHTIYEELDYHLYNMTPPHTARKTKRILRNMYVDYYEHAEGCRYIAKHPRQYGINELGIWTLEGQAEGYDTFRDELAKFLGF